MSILKPTHTPEEIAKKFNVSIDKINAQLVKGIRVESEHTTDKSIARQIALHHLWEKPNYYDLLKKVEEGKSLWYFLDEAAMSVYPSGFREGEHRPGKNFNGYTYYFDVGDQKYQVYLSISNDGVYGKMLDVAFSIKGEDGWYLSPDSSKNSKAAKVLSYVVSTLANFLTKHKDIDYITFSTNDASRMKAYRMMTKRFASIGTIKSYGSFHWSKSIYVFLTKAARDKFDDKIKTWKHEVEMIT